MGKKHNRRGKGIAGGELRPHDPGNPRNHLLWTPMCTNHPVLLLRTTFLMGNLLQHLIPSVIPFVFWIFFYSKANRMYNEADLLAQDLDDALTDKDLELARKIMDQKELLRKQILKLTDRTSLLSNQCKVMIKELDSTGKLSDSIQPYYKVVEMPSEKFCKVEMEAPILHASKSYEIVEVEIVHNFPWEEFKLVNVIYINAPADSMNLDDQQFDEIDSILDMRLKSGCCGQYLEIVEEEFVTNFPRKEFKLVNVIYINAPADIKHLDEQQFEEIDSILDLKLKSGCCVEYLVDFNGKTDENEKWKKKFERKCESKKLLNLDFSRGYDLDTQNIYGTEDRQEIIGQLYLELTKNLKNVGTGYLSPALYSWDVHNGPSNRLFSHWFVYDRGKFAFYV